VRFRRAGFTLVELLVVLAVVLVIMVVLSRAFGSGVTMMSRAKSVGDLHQKLRSATSVLRRDLSADHFDGRRRASDWDLGTNRPREGFFVIYSGARTRRADGGWNNEAGRVLEGTDGDGVPSFRVTQRSLHFTVKLRGNEPQSFFAAKMPPGSPLQTQGTTFVGLPADARFQEANTSTYQSQWAEVYYYLKPTGARAGSTPLFALYRGQYLAVADNSALRGKIADTPDNRKAYAEFSISPDLRRRGMLHFNTPMDLAGDIDNGVSPVRSPLQDPTKQGTLLLTDVLSFEIVGWNRDQWNQWETNILTKQYAYEGYINFNSSSPAYQLDGVRIILRVWDVRTDQARQVTLWQPM
jgi:prepilin-type N-terminal cleavage/methylation domain-containing protein